MGDERTQAPQQDNHEPASAEKSAAQEKTPSPASSYLPAPGLSISGASSGNDIPITRDNILYLQRTIGNRAVVQLLQRKAKISQPGDEYEREADQVAEQVLSAPSDDQAGFIQRKAINRAEEEQKKRPEEEGSIQKKALPGSEAQDSASGQRNLPGGSGQPLDANAKNTLEHSFNTRLDNVRIHDDAQAQNFVSERKAYAVTFGQDIYAGPGTLQQSDGKVSHTLAHEVAHTIQQRSSVSEGQIKNVNQYQSLEHQADQAADSVLRANPASVQAGVADNMEQAEGQEGEASSQVFATEVIVLMTKVMSDEQREILQTHPPTYNRVIKLLIAYDAGWITDTLLELWVDDDNEAGIIAALRKWAMTPKIEGGNYLDEILNAIRGYSYSFDYLVTESASGNMLDKLYAEMEGDNYSSLTTLVDSFSVRFAGYRGRGDIGRWSGIQTAVMPSEVRDRLSRLNQRLAGRVTLPMTPEEVQKINALYAELRSETFGMIDMPDLQLGPAEGQQAAQAIAVPVVGVAALIYALILAILVTITLYIILQIIIEIERALDRLEYSNEPWSPPVEAPPVEAPPPVKAPPIEAPPITGAPPIPIPIPFPIPVQPTKPEPEPKEDPKPDPGKGPGPTVDPFPPELPRKRKQPPVIFFHGTDEPSAVTLAAGAPVLPIGGGEFGQGFYTFMEETPAELAAAQYTRARGLPMWGVVDFQVPVEVLVEHGLASEILREQPNILIFPDRTTSVPVRYPDDLGGIEVSMTWQEFVDENRRIHRGGGYASWPYDMIVGPLSGRLPGYRNVNQYLFNDYGIVMLNDPRVARFVVSTGPT